MIEFNGVKYELIENKKDAFQSEEFENRYSDILKKYDYIVGDWGHSQLRLKGFYQSVNRSKDAYESSIDLLEDYLYEYCNFGCAYFVIRKVD